MIAFLALIAACFVFVRHFAASHHRISAAVSTATGAVFLAAWISIFVLQGARLANVSLALAIATVLIYTSLLAAHQLHRLQKSGAARASRHLLPVILPR
jgi:hypothetical protein